jgi:very-short-patch-repair endonuclease
MHRVPPEMTERARQLRRDATPAERKLWRILSGYRPAFTRQLVVGSYIVDLACREAKLAIELDGSQHLDQQEYDGKRTAYLESMNWRVIRLWNSDVMTNPDGAAEYLLAQAAECLGGPHPQPLPSREGRIRKPRTPR